MDTVIPNIVSLPMGWEGLDAPFESYLLIQRMEDAEVWAMELREEDELSLPDLVDRFVRGNFGGELERDGDLLRTEGEYYASIKLDGNRPCSVSCWDSGGFFVNIVE